MTPKTKVCSACGQKLPLTSFSRKKDNVDGLQYQCRKCYNKQQRMYNKNHSEQIKATLHRSYLRRKSISP